MPGTQEPHSKCLPKKYTNLGWQHCSFKTPKKGLITFISLGPLGHCYTWRAGKFPTLSRAYSGCWTKQRKAEWGQRSVSWRHSSPGKMWWWPVLPSTEVTITTVCSGPNGIWQGKKVQSPGGTKMTGPGGNSRSPRPLFNIGNPGAQVQEKPLEPSKLALVSGCRPGDVIGNH